MRISCTLLLCLTVVLNSIELSVQSNRAEQPLRERSKSPTLRETFPIVLGYKLEDLASIRLIPHNCPHRKFELRRYVFPEDKQITFRTRNSVPRQMSTGEQIVLSTSDGDVCAILEKTPSKHTLLRAIFTPVFGMSARVKINMNSGAVKQLSAEEIAECPVSTDKLLIAKIYSVSRLCSESKTLPDGDPDTGSRHCAPSSSTIPGKHFSARSPPPAEQPLHDGLKSRDLKQIFPRVLRFRFEDLIFIRLVPHNYPNRIFELRIYVFPQDKQLGLRTFNNVLNPMPKGEQIVLSKGNGDVCALLEKTARNATVLRPIFTSFYGLSKRVRINIGSGAVEELSTEEMAECPVNSKGQIPKVYSVFRV